MTTATQPAVPPLDTPKPRRSALVFGAAIVIIVALLGLLMWTLQQKGAPPLAAGQAPAFDMTSFEGKSYRLSELRGTPVVINFWASWCTQCKDEARELEAIWKQYKGQGLLVLGVDYVDTEPEAKAYMAQYGITFPNGPDLGTKISKAYRITGVPETYFIKADGTLLTGSDATGRPFGNWIGPIPLTNLQERVRKLMGM